MRAFFYTGIILLAVAIVSGTPSLLLVASALIGFPMVVRLSGPSDDDVPYIQLRERYVRSELTLQEFESEVECMYSKEFELDL